MIAAFAFSLVLRLGPHDGLLNQVEPARLRATVEALVQLPNRNTNNATLDRAADILEAEYRKIPGLKVERMRYTAKQGPRVPVEKTVVQIVATLPGEDERRILIGGHFDTINMTDRTLDAITHGADDDASGTALALECARILSQRKWKHTLVFVAFSGEEQGLLGSGALAQRAKDEGWKIDAVLSNDIVGCSKNANGQSDPRHIRLFSEDPALLLTDSPRHNSRELARFIEWNSRKTIAGFGPKLVFRKDRFQRGGDHTPFNNLGFTAVRFTEPFEEFTRQHNEKDLPEFLDYPFLANVTRLNLHTAATLANAGDAPTNVRMDPKQAHDTKLTWTAKPGVRYVVYYRDSASPVWQTATEVGEVNAATIVKVNKDETIFAVGAVGGIPIEAR